MTTIKLKNGSGAPTAGDLVQGEPALDLTNKRLYTEDSGGTVIEVGTNPTSITTGDITATGTATFANLATSGDVTFGDNDKAIFGAGSDLQIYHDGVSRIKELGAGGLYVDVTNDMYIRRGDTSAVMAEFNAGVAKLMFDGSQKLATTSTGIDVTGTVTADDITLSDTDTPTLTLTDTTNTVTNIVKANNSIGTVGTSTANDLYIQSNDTVRQRVRSNGDISFYNDSASSQAFYWDASTSRLGLGTTSPARDLHIVENDDWAQIRLEGNSSGGAEIMMGDSTTESKGRIQYVNASNYMRFDTNATERMRITSSGTLLVGKSSSAFGTAGVEINQNGVAGKVFMTRSGGDPLSLNRLSSDGEIQGFYKDGTQVGYVGSSGNDMYLGNSITGVMFNDANNAILPWRTNQLDDANINIGLGLYRFKDLYLSGTAYSAALNVDGGSSGIINFGDVTSNYGRLYADSTGTYVGSVTANPLILRTTNTERMRITSAGNVGIGDSNPARKLTVQGGSGDTLPIRVVGGSGTTTGGIEFQDASTTADYKVQIGSIGDNLYLRAGGAERMRIDSSGNVQIGTAAVTGGRYFDIYNTGSTATDFAITRFITQQVGSSSTTSADVYKRKNGEFGFANNDTDSAAYINFKVGTSNRMRLTSSGDLLVGTTSTPTGSTGGSAFITESVGRKTLKIASTTTSGAGLAEFINPNGVVGTIVTNGSATAYNTSSDQRLKENIVDAPSASDDIDAIQVRSFDWKADGSHQKYGMVAQELQTVAPEAVTEGETEEDMMGVDYSKLVPMLVKEIQSLRARVAQLEND